MPKPKKSDRPLPPTPAGAAVPAEGFDMVFHCQLAHGSPTRQVRDFTNVKQLYESIAKAFNIKSEEILYCTLNTHKVDMSRLLGGQIGLDDFLFAHVKGAVKDAKVAKNGPALGLTISDNGAGYAFIKKIRDGSIMADAKNVAVGDHIEEINGHPLKGCRHFEVARMLKEIHIGSEFTMKLVEPKKAFDAIAPRQAMGGTGEVKAGAGKKTMRMKATGGAEVIDNITDDVQKVIDKVDDLLEQYVGIKDQELSTTIHELALSAPEPEVFAGKLDADLGDFAFPDDFVLDVHDMIHKS
jgi:hypothetical protein